MSKTAYGNLRSIVNGTFNYAYSQLGLEQVLNTKRIFESESLPNRLFLSTRKKDESQVFTNAEVKALADAAENNSDLRADQSYVKYYMRHTLYETTQRCYHFSRAGREGKQLKAQELDAVLRKIS